ncbi:Spore coat polysaccharide biosynthesis protein SpsF [Candidatus Magnetomorum sp. HK-1]|nr:Spore coat polysaccharide biosynthesis protein SpsF [Candidatus Magnetomorum sp. HK-1]
MKFNTIVVIQCRYSSSRLLGKAVYPLSGIPMLIFLIRRLKISLPENLFQIILATTNNSTDDIIYVWGKSENIPVVRGDEKDVLKRYIQTLKEYPAQTIVRVTADNPLTCPEIIKCLVKKQQEQNADYAFCENLPYGTASDIFSYNLLVSLDKEIVSAIEREHINLHVLNNIKKFKVTFTNATGKMARPDLNMTVDTISDWYRVKALFDQNEKEPWKITLSEAIKRMDKSSL